MRSEEQIRESIGASASGEPGDVAWDDALNWVLDGDPWIRCIDRMPDKDALVAFTYSDADGTHVVTGFWNGETWCEGFDEWTIDSETVGHWMPMPAPPTGTPEAT